MNGRTQFLRKVLWAIALLAGALQAFATRYAMNADGVSYVDIGENYFTLGWRQAISGYFSPLYSWIIGLALTVFQPSPAAEAPLIHAVNFLLYVAALGGFTLFLNALLDYLRYREAQPGESGSGLPEWSWVLLGYSLFIWVMLNFAGLGLVTPDLLYAALIFTVFALVLRMRMGAAGMGTAAAFGLLIGLGYLARAAILPLALVLLVIAAGLIRNRVKAFQFVAVAMLAFVAVAAPYVYMLSTHKGRFTFGDTGKMIYSWHVNGKPWQHWRGPEAAHPSRIIHRNPVVYEFAAPVPGTYPVWYDASYWNEGMRPEINLKQQLFTLAMNAKDSLDLVLQMGGVLVACLSLWFIAFDARALAGRLWAEWPLWLPALAGLGIYLLLHIEPRYIVAFWIVLWLSLFLAVRLPGGETAGPAIVAGMAGYLLIGVLSSLMISVYWGREAKLNLTIAERLQTLGVRPGDSLATVGVDNNPYWARLARSRIIAEIPGTASGEFWAADDAVKGQVYEALSRAGARWLVGPGAPAAAGWTPLAGTPFFAYRLDGGQRSAD